MNSPTYQAMVTVTIPVQVTAEQAARLDWCRNRLYDFNTDKIDRFAPVVPIVDISMAPYRVVPEISISIAEAKNSINQEPICMVSEHIAKHISNEVARQIQRAVTDAVRTSIKMELQK